ncbi:MAG: ATP-binding protein [Kiritimatiellae bacterium]|nr:ATP-binding protein [Kiritimatiellia bacterium]
MRLGDNDLSRVILGPRRCGKSSLAMHLTGAEASRGYVNFDDERLTGLQDTDGLIAAIDAVYGKPKHLLPDEIRNIERWELLVNRLRRQGYRLYLTGSNAHLLSSELATHLTGRHIPIVLFPFSFAEYLASIEGPVTGPEREERLRTYAEEGGMPEPLFHDLDRIHYLRTLWDSILYKDIVKRHRIRSVAGIENLAGYLLANVTCEYSLNRLMEVTLVRSVHTIQKYLHHLSEALLFFSLSRYSVRFREQTRANRKVYCIDNGFVTARGFQFTDKTGARFENIAAVMLHKRQLEGKCEVFFWRGARNEEVDFVVKEGRRVAQLIEVCWNMRGAGTRDREVRSLPRASKALSCDDLLILTAATEREEQAEWYGTRRAIRLVPMSKWLE